MWWLRKGELRANGEVYERGRMKMPVNNVKNISLFIYFLQYWNIYDIFAVNI